jgi:hypothetical protein
MRTFLIFLIITISGCATPVYKDVFREKVSYNSQEFPVPQNVLYQATSRAICSKNFIIEKEDPNKGFILAKRSFQRGKRTIALIIQAKIDPIAADKTTLFLNAIETKEVYFVADRTRFFLFIIPLPGGGGKEGSQIKEGEKVVEDKTFYNNFFEAIEKEIAKIPQGLSPQTVTGQPPPKLLDSAQQETVPFSKGTVPEAAVPKEVAVPAPEGTDPEM